MGRVLIGCEFSGVVRRAFAARGLDAWSCDLLPAEDRSNKHIVGDVRDVLDDGWDLLIVAHPPCTRLCNSGVRWLSVPPRGRTHEDMRRELEEGAALFSDCWNAPVPRICVENPVMHRHAKALIRNYTPPAQSVQPWQFGHGETKRTCLWLRNLPPLVPTEIVEGREARVHRMPPGPHRWRERSRFFAGIADAMAAQWGTDSDHRNPEGRVMARLAISPRDLIPPADYRAIRARLRGSPAHVLAFAPVHAVQAAVQLPAVDAPAPPSTARVFAGPRHKQILRAVAEVFNVTTCDIIGRSKSHMFTRPRHAAAYLMHIQTRMSLSEIGRRMGRDHTTTMNSTMRVQAALDSVGASVAADTDPTTAAMIIQDAFDGRLAVDESIVADIAFDRVPDAICIGWLESKRPFASMPSVAMKWVCSCGRKKVMPKSVKP